MKIKTENKWIEGVSFIGLISRIISIIVTYSTPIVAFNLFADGLFELGRKYDMLIFYLGGWFLILLSLIYAIDMFIYHFYEEKN